MFGKQEGDIFRTIIPLKKIATQKVGGSGVAHSVAHDKIALAEFIKEKIRENDMDYSQVSGHKKENIVTGVEGYLPQ